MSDTVQRLSTSSPQSTLGEKGAEDLLQEHRKNQGQLVSQLIYLAPKPKQGPLGHRGEWYW